VLLTCLIVAVLVRHSSLGCDDSATAACAIYRAPGAPPALPSERAAESVRRSLGEQSGRHPAGTR
jgi:hypothetical protein